MPGYMTAIAESLSVRNGSSLKRRQEKQNEAYGKILRLSLLGNIDDLPEKEPQHHPKQANRGFVTVLEISITAQILGLKEKRKGAMSIA